MTRINCVPVTELSDKHLLAEYRELPRVYPLAFKAWQRGDLYRSPSDLPSCYTLGKGHVKFFYVRLGYLTGRYRSLVHELKQRGFNPLYISPRQEHMDKSPAWMWLHWEPDAAALQLNRARLKARMPAAYPQLTMEGECIGSA